MIKRAPFGCLAVVIFILSATTISAQLPAERPTKPPPVQQPGGEPAAQPCPPVAIQPQPVGTLREGQKVYFTANYPSNGEPKPGLTIVWNTSAGSILQGQGSNRVEVDTTGSGNTTEREVKAEVWINGFAPDCIMQASATVKIIPPASKFGDFGEVSSEKFSSNLKSLAEFLNQAPAQDNLYVIVYAGRNSERGFTQTWAKRIKSELTAGGLADSRIYAMDGGFREQPLFDFWIVPSGADPPKPEPTIKRSEIVYPKTTPAKKP